MGSCRSVTVASARTLRLRALSRLSFALPVVASQLCAPGQVVDELVEAEHAEADLLVGRFAAALEQAGEGHGGRPAEGRGQLQISEITQGPRQLSGSRGNGLRNTPRSLRPVGRVGWEYTTQVGVRKYGRVGVGELGEVVGSDSVTQDVQCLERRPLHQLPLLKHQPAVQAERLHPVPQRAARVAVEHIGPVLFVHGHHLTLHALRHGHRLPEAPGSPVGVTVEAEGVGRGLAQLSEALFALDVVGVGGNQQAAGLQLEAVTRAEGEGGPFCRDGGGSDLLLEDMFTLEQNSHGLMIIDIVWVGHRSPGDSVIGAADVAEAGHVVPRRQLVGLRGVAEDSDEEQEERACELVVHRARVHGAVARQEGSAKDAHKARKHLERDRNSSAGTLYVTPLGSL
ncbi:hypothetical protein EYF80_009427 [Liparis tanakae]|uniref:Uncharacterized protein n=1 Tax=Liparis tanakae TaxID=230148 RepID=A0A4Z2IT92_9TELE|nr:hypothetical protein EYF80_009427 [Liparis tanakae]